MKISDYVPVIYQDNVEMNALINAEENELENNTKVLVENAFKDNFPINATENGIVKFEKLLNIQRDAENDSINYRRNKIITTLTTTFPLTLKWLKDSLDGFIGSNNYEINLDAQNYTLLIKCSNIFDNTLTILYNYYRPLIPSNLILRITVAEQHSNPSYIGGILHQGDKVLIERIGDN